MLFARWADERKNVFKSPGPIQLPVDKPPRGAQYWQECKVDCENPDAVMEPPPYARGLVSRRTAARLDKKRRFRKPMFRRDQVLQLWP